MAENSVALPMSKAKLKKTYNETQYLHFQGPASLYITADTVKAILWAFATDTNY